ncbi:hypothetical protein [Stagnihabitans tardus]|uniref:Phage tail protein n=1 Tax=Stagnihabitans tardus TaxID=2699202 RepID=A0AAE5BUH1_9RHOB|nr:hypothetical protein [Stagnihabitans tardus]NBZ87906.1 hypothetical protein [Stagnihabitans tardus]
MAVYTIAGSKFEVGIAGPLQNTDYVAADFTGATKPLSAVNEVGEPETFGTVSDPWDTEDFTNVTYARTRVFKTVRKGSTVELTCGLDPTDTGQIFMRTAYAATLNYGFRLTLADKPTSGATPKNSTRMFMGTVINVEDDPSGKIGKVKFTIQINSNIVRTDASPT